MPHDVLFKLFLMDVEMAQEFLQIHLPNSLQQQFDFKTLTCLPAESFRVFPRSWILCKKYLH
ncbi:Rpn family recombination-promoting nuclease/putative transposase [Mycoavidus sp. B2-EB]|uniref:Rpn family recombination-promoting nuclease/putative transposase n=1 Tax=Mycoavidus sp. B2-EB TaxID=2651972 RepID=UPI00351C1637